MAKFYPGKNVYINSTDIASIPGIVIEAAKIGKPPKRILEAYQRARAHGKVLVAGYYDAREIQIFGKYITSSQAAAEAARDVLLAAINQLNSSLRLPVAGVMREYIVSLEDMTPSDEAGGLGSFTLNFNCYQPWGVDAADTDLGNTVVTQANRDIVTAGFSGTFPDQFPVITLIVGAVTGSTSASTMTLLNNATGQAVKLTGIVTAGDIITIDTRTGIVYRNALQVEFAGVAAPTPIGPVTYTYTDTGITTRSITVGVKYRKRYL